MASGYVAKTIIGRDDAVKAVKQLKKMYPKGKFTIKNLNGPFWGIYGKDVPKVVLVKSY